MKTKCIYCESDATYIVQSIENQTTEAFCHQHEPECCRIMRNSLDNSPDAITKFNEFVREAVEKSNGNESIDKDSGNATT